MTKTCAWCGEQAEIRVYQGRELTGLPLGWSVMMVTGTPTVNLILCGKHTSLVMKLIVGEHKDVTVAKTPHTADVGSGPRAEEGRDLP